VPSPRDIHAGPHLVPPPREPGRPDLPLEVEDQLPRLLRRRRHVRALILVHGQHPYTVRLHRVPAPVEPRLLLEPERPRYPLIHESPPDYLDGIPYGQHHVVPGIRPLPRLGPEDVPEAPHQAEREHEGPASSPGPQFHVREPRSGLDLPELVEDAQRCAHGLPGRRRALRFMGGSVAVYAVC